MTTVIKEWTEQDSYVYSIEKNIIKTTEQVYRIEKSDEGKLAVININRDGRNNDTRVIEIAKDVLGVEGVKPAYIGKGVLCIVNDKELQDSHLNFDAIQTAESFN